mgnify:CR=1 FL=1
MVVCNVDAVFQICSLYPQASEDYQKFVTYIRDSHQQAQRFDWNIFNELILESFQQKQNLKMVLELGRDLRREIPFSLRVKHKPYYRWIIRALAYLVTKGI